MDTSFGQDPELRERLRAEAALVGIHRVDVDAADGLPLATWRAEPSSAGGSAPTVLLLHGATFSSMCTFDLAVPGLERSSCSALLRLGAAGFPVVALDLAGYGSSGRRGSLGTVEDDVSDVRTVLTAMRAESPGGVAVLGWSWGAQLAAVVAAEGLVDALVFYAGRWRPAPAAAGSRRPAWGEWRATSRLLAGWDFSTPDNFSPQVRDAFSRRVLELDRTVPTTAMRYLAGAGALFDPARITCPVLAVAGADDPSRDDADRAAMLARLGAEHSRELVVANADHNAHLDESRSSFYEGIVTFLSYI